MSEHNISILVEKLHKAQNTENKEDIKDAQLELAQYYFDTENFQKAKKILLDVKKDYEKEFGVNYALGLIELQEKSNNEKALKYFRTEIKYNPEHKQAIEILEKLEINSNFPFVTIILVLLNILFFLFFYEKSFEYVLLYTLNDFSFSLIQTFISIFFHSSLLHLSINVLILLMFGLILEKYIGSIKFLVIFLFGGFFGNLVEYIFSTGNVYILGASGGIFAIFGALLMREPLLDLRIFGIIKIPLVLVLGVFISISYFISDYLLINGFNSGDMAHMTGFLFGVLIFGLLYNSTIDTFYNWIFIIIGFYIIFSIMFNYYLISDVFSFIVALFLFLFGLFLIYFSYMLLRDKQLELGVYEK